MELENIEREYPFIWQRILEYIGTRPVYQITDLSGAFTWSDTEEKHSFWSHVYNGNIEEAKELCPHLFLIPSTNCIKNGLLTR